MKFLTKGALAAAALVAASPVMFAMPAAAQVTVTVANPNLDPKIKADDFNDGINETVFGTTGVARHDVKFTGNTGINITDGAGFAVIRGTDKTPDFWELIINPNQLFTQYEFSISLFDAGNLFVDYMLVGGTFQPSNGSPIAQRGSANISYLVDSGGLALDAIRIRTSSFIDFQRQNAITLAPGAVPEPGTWAMMLLGFAGIGAAARRSRRKSSTLLQIA